MFCARSSHHSSVNDQSFNVVDIKPENMEELTEVITSAEFHPTQCNLMMYSSSKVREALRVAVRCGAAELLLAAGHHQAVRPARRCAVRRAVQDV